MAEDAFARKERKVPPRTRPAPVASPDERVTVVCGCGVVMTLSWRRAEPVHCFGCRRVFAPPPTVTGAPLRWRPELVPRERPPLRAIALAATIASVLLLLLALAVHVLRARPD